MAKKNLKNQKENLNIINKSEFKHNFRLKITKNNVFLNEKKHNVTIRNPLTCNISLRIKKNDFSFDQCDSINKIVLRPRKIINFMEENHLKSKENVQLKKEQPIKRELRIRSSKSNVDCENPIVAIEKIKNIVSANPKIQINKQIDIEWQKCIKNKNIKLNVMQVVMSKMKSYCAWPSRINSISTSTDSATVYFFGTGQIGKVPINQIVPFEKCSKVILLLLTRTNKKFESAIEEAEKYIGIPDNLSVFNQSKS